VTVFDPELITVQDLSSQFFLRPEDVGKSRADVTVPRLAELNAYVPVRNMGGKPGQLITPDMLKGFQAIVLCGVPLDKQLEINDWTHANDVNFIAAETKGLFGYVYEAPLFIAV